MGFGEQYLQAEEFGQSYVLYSSEVKAMSAPASKRPEEREFVVNSRASMHMMSKKRIKLRRDGHIEVVLTANGELHTNEEAQGTSVRS